MKKIAIPVKEYEKLKEIASLSEEVEKQVSEETESRVYLRVFNLITGKEDITKLEVIDDVSPESKVIVELKKLMKKEETNASNSTDEDNKNSDPNS